MKAITFLIKLFRVKLGYFNLIITLSVIFFYTCYQLKYYYPINFKSLLALVLAIISTNLVGLLINFITNKYRKTGVTLSISYLVFLYLLLSYKIKSNNDLDLGLITGNYKEIFSMESLTVIINASIGKNKIIAIFLFSVLLLVLEKFFRIFSSQSQKINLKIKSLFFLTCFLVLSISTNNNFDSFSNLIRTAFSFNKNKVYYDLYNSTLNYPYIKVEKETASTQQKFPNVFIIFIESLNSNYINKETTDGIEITPFINSLSKKSLYVKNFYSNSIQTCRGHFATLAGILPSFKRKTYYNESIKLHMLNNVLKENNYYTLFMQADDQINFDNTYNFLSHHGFDHVSSVNPYLEDNDKDFILGWDVQDDIYYKRFFSFLDNKKHEINDKQIFSVLATITTHRDFDFLTPSQMHVYKNPSTYSENYANTVHLADQFLKTFFDELSKRDYLKNSLVIVTGDHGYPTGEHGYTNNEVAAYNEFFKTLFLMYWEGKIQPRVIDAPYSQIDIAPTLIDVLNIPLTRHHFIGSSMLKKNKAKPIFLIQPYNGRILSVIFKNYKYVFNMKTNDEFMYNLEVDPEENINVISEIKENKIDLYLKLKNYLNDVYLNQVLLETDQVWDK